MFGKKKSRPASRPNTRRKGLQVESLEQRKLMTVGMSLSANGLLSIRGDDTADNITVYQTSGVTLVKSINSAGVLNITNMGTSVKALDIDVKGGNDIVNNNTALPSTIYGGAGDDTINGGSARDDIYGQQGNDTLRGNGGSDVLWGYTGNDTLYGSAGSDSLYGQDGDDVLFGGGGSDWLSGGAGADSLYGDDWLGATIVDGVAAGKDTMYGGDGNDMLYGGANNDTLYGGAGDDHLFGYDGNDRLFGEMGTDTLCGQAGDDFLDPGTYGEFASGDDGLDFNAYVTTVNGATANDIAQGASGNCFLLAPMGTAAERGVDMASRISYVGNGHYNVSLFKQTSSGAYTPTTVNVAFDGTLNPADPTAHFRGQEGESWTVIMDRALAQLFNIDISTTTGGYASDTLGALTGRAPQTPTWTDHSGYVSPFERDGLLDYLYAVGNGAPCVVDTRNSDVLVSNMLIGNHSYMVKAVYISGYTYSPYGMQMIPQYTILLQNPWGNDGAAVSSGDRSDGLVVISGAQFKQDFFRIDVA